jgi:tetratricopeptide (TPR) repeat protein
MRRFPRNEVAPTAGAETLRELGRPEEALAAFEETMRRFPRNEVAPTAGAETLRELGRPEEALAAFEETMRRFPRSEVAPNACADLLGSLGRLDEAEALLAAAAARSRTHGDWIAVHILAMARLRAGRVEEALAELDRGVRFCPFRDSRRYFETARPLALLAARRAAEAAREWEALAQDPTVDPRERTNILLFEAHARAEAGEPGRAQSLVTSAQVIDFAAAKQKRLAAALTERYGLVSGMWASGARAQQLSDDITALELELVRPKLWSFRARAA